MTSPSQSNATPSPAPDRSRLGVWWWTTDHLLLGATRHPDPAGRTALVRRQPGQRAARMNIADPFHFAVRQCLFAAGGAVLLLVVSMLSPRGVRRTCFFIYLIAIVIMAVLPLMGHHAKGATRWLTWGGFSLQNRRSS